MGCFVDHTKYNQEYSKIKTDRAGSSMKKRKKNILKVYMFTIMSNVPSVGDNDINLTDC